jgi:hypothetical protein
MAMGRPKAVLVLDAEQREQLESLANSRALPAGLTPTARQRVESSHFSITTCVSLNKQSPPRCLIDREIPS